MTVLGHRADLVRVVETANAGPSLDERGWQHATRSACEAMLARAHAVGFHVLDDDDDDASLERRGEERSIAPSGVETARMAEAFAAFATNERRALSYPSVPVTTMRSTLGRLGAPSAALVRGWLHALRAEDVLLVVMQPLPGRTLLLWAAHDAPVTIDRRERQALTQLALHIEAGYRARTRPESVRAELSEDARVVWRKDDAPHANVLEAHAARVVRARSTDARTTFEGLDLWPALVAGRASLVPRRIDGRDRYLVIENAPVAGALARLGPDERAVAGLASRGLSTKLVAYALGVSSSLVSLRLALAAAKLGVATRAELVRLAALLAAEAAPPRAVERLALTDAERDVLTLLQRGFSNRRIAEERSRSVRTVANQVASLLKKTGSTSRRALVVRDAGLHPDVPSPSTRLPLAGAASTAGAASSAAE